MRSTYIYLLFLCYSTLSYAQIEVATSGIPGDVNSKFQDVRPVISDNGKILYLNRRFHPENIRGDRDFQDVWVSKFDPRGIWTKPVNLGEPYNNKKANDLVRASAENDSLVFVSADYKGVRSELSMFLKSNKQAIEMPIDGYYNKSTYVDFDYNFKQKVIIMAVERKDSEGDQDLYYSIYQPQDNSYSTPMHMGKNINTDKADFAPFLTVDGNTLFFASYGRGGQGGADLFMSHREGDGWDNWTTPENLGNVINTAFEETFVSVSPDFQYLYYDSYPSGAVNRDIWRATLSEDLKNKIIVARDNKRSRVIGMTAETKTVADPTIVDASRDSLNNEQFSVLNIGESTTEQATDSPDPSEQPGTPALDIETAEFTEKPSTGSSKGFFAKIGEKFGIGIDKEPLKYYDAGAKGMKINENVYFDFNADKVQHQYNHLLEQIVNELNDKTQAKILVEGHTDGIGGEDINIDLSCRRAKNIKNDLVKLGVNPLRIEISCEGKERPLATNDDETEGRELNRRVEFYLF